MLRTALILAAILALASCSLQLDSQYGLRLGPAAIKRDVPGGKPANPENRIVLLEPENRVLFTEPTGAIESEPVVHPNYSVETDASILSDQGHSTDPAELDIKTYSESGSIPNEVADPKPEGQALQDDAENSQSKPLWLAIVAIVISIPLMAFSAYLIYEQIYNLIYFYDPSLIFILGVSILGLVLGYLLFRWAMRNLPSRQALQDAKKYIQSKPLWLVIVAIIISIPLMIISLLLIALAFFGMVWEFYPFHIFILGIGILGMVLGYLLFRWAKRKFLQVRMPGRSLDPKARLFLGLVLGLLAILLTGF
jgi:hypothetical protein